MAEAFFGGIGCASAARAVGGAMPFGVLLVTHSIGFIVHERMPSTHGRHLNR